MSPNQLADAREAIKFLEGQTTLLDAAKYWKKYARPAGGIRTFNEIRDEFIKSRIANNLKQSTINQYSSSVGIICDTFGKTKVNQIKAEDIEEWLAESEWAPKTRRNYLTDITTMLGWAMSRGYCVENVGSKITRPKLTEMTPGILTAKQAQLLLQAAQKYLPEMVPGISIGLFSGLRRSEICAIDWKFVRFRYVIKDNKTAEIKTVESLSSSGDYVITSYGSIEVSGAIAKKRQRRTVEMSKNLRDWLLPFRQSEGPITPAIEIYGEKLRRLVKGYQPENGDPGDPPIVNPWPHNGLRHSFASYKLALTHDDKLVSSEMGNSPEMVHSHYKDLVQEPDLSAYWNIFP